jgi:hypothetical protein
MLLRQGDLAFENIPVDGSSKMDDALMESIEPFDLSKSVDFQTAYLSGFFADRYDVSSDASSEVSSEATSEVTSDAGSAGEGGDNGVESVMVFAVLGMAAALFVITFRKVRA